MVITTTLITVLLAVFILIIFTGLLRQYSPFTLKTNPAWLVGSQLLCVLIWQLTYIRNEEYNVDESTWMASALAVLHEENFASALLTHTTARPITVLPLLILDQLRVPLDFYSVKVLALVFILITLLLTYLSLRNLTTNWLATLFIFPLVVFYLTVQYDDFLAYNSELVCTVLVTSGVWLYSLIVGKRDRPWSLMGAGLLMGLVPFAKFQAIPGTLVVAGFCLYALIRQRRFGSAFFVTAAGFLPLVAASGYCLLTGQMTVLTRDYFLYYFHYSYQYSLTSFSERFAPSTILHYYQRQSTAAVYWFGLLMLIGIGVWPSRRIPGRWSSTTLMAGLLWIISIYETIQSGTNYEHYQNLVFVPHTLLAALLIYPVVKNRPVRTTFFLYGYLAVALTTTFFSRAENFEPGYKPPLPYDAEVIALIRKESGPQDRLTIWGWADRYYVLSGVAPASRFVNSVVQIQENAQQAYYLDQYVQDLQQNKPLLFIDAVAPNQFMYGDPRVYGHEQFPTVNRVITTDYQLIFEREGLRAYRIKKRP